MKKGIIEVEFDDEKMEAIRFYLSKKEQTLENEMQNIMKTLYEKVVPAEVRGYIEKRSTDVVKKTRKKKEVSNIEVSDGDQD